MIGIYFDDEEWLSNCCTAHPLFDLHHEEGIDTIGLCSHCKEHAEFILYKDDE